MLGGGVGRAVRDGQETLQAGHVDDVAGLLGDHVRKDA